MKQVGNAVPPLLAKAIADIIMADMPQSVCTQCGFSHHFVSFLYIFVLSFAEFFSDS